MKKYLLGIFLIALGAIMGGFKGNIVINILGCGVFAYGLLVSLTDYNKEKI